MSPNLDVLKEPRGFIKIIEIFISIFAFACLSGFRGHIKIEQLIRFKHNASQAAAVTHTYVAFADFQYPFDGATIKTAYVFAAKTINKTSVHDVSLNISEEHNAQLFMVIAVFCFLYVLVTIVYYVFFEKDKSAASSQPTNKFTTSPVIDFCIGGFWTFFWFVSACALAASIHSIKAAVNTEELAKKLVDCIPAYVTCKPVLVAKFSTLTVAVLMGFLNCFVWAGNMWFLWKETPWHRDAHDSAATVDNTMQPPQQVPAAAI